MKRLVSLILTVLMLVSCLAPFSLFSASEEQAPGGAGTSAAEYRNTVVSFGKPATIGSVKASVPKVTDGITSTNNNYVDSTNYGLVKPRSEVASSTCYVEIDLGREYPVSAVNTVTYSKAGRVYKWDVYLSNDNGKHISEWTLAGGKTTDEASTYDGYTVEFTPITARYVRIYGTANSDNTSFHWIEVLVYANLNNVSLSSSAVSGKGGSVPVVTDGAFVNTNSVDIPWGSTAGDESTAYGLSGNCFVEIDLGEIYDLTDVNVVNYIANRYYHWEAYGSCDKDAPVSAYTKLCEKKDSVYSTAYGYTASFEKTPVRYLRVYGTYNSANTGYHFVEISAFTGDTVKTNAAKSKAAQSSDGIALPDLTDGIFTSNVSLGNWGSDASLESSSYGIAGNCFAQIDLAAPTEIFALAVQNPDRNYKWSAYASNDDTLPITSWTKLGEKTEIKNNAYNEIGFHPAQYRYVRVYGLYNASNADFHINEICIFTDAKTSIPEIGIEPVGDGFVNASGENATNGFSTELVLRLTGGAITASDLKAGVLSGDYTVNLIFTDAYGAPYEICASPKFFDGDDVWYFEPVYAGFVPTKGQIYDMRVNVYDALGKIAYTGSNDSFVCRINPVYVYDGAYEPQVEILSFNGGTPITEENGSYFLWPSGIHEKYFLTSDPSVDGYDLNYTLKLFINGVEYPQFELEYAGGVSYTNRLGKIDLTGLGFAPEAHYAHDVVLEAYVRSYPSGEPTLEGRYYFPSFSLDADLYGFSCEIYAVQGGVSVGYANGTYMLEATGSDLENYVFDGWYADGKLVSRDDSYSFVMTEGSSSLIVGIYAPGSEETLGASNVQVYDAPVVDDGGASPVLTYEFYNDLKGSASGKATFNASESGTYSFYWLDAQNNKLSVILNGKTVLYSALASFTLTAGQACAYTPAPFTAIPYGARKLAVYKGNALIVSAALPEEKLLTSSHEYAYGLMSDLHYNSFPKYVSGGGETDYAIDACQTAYAFFGEVGITTVFQTGDYSTYQDEVAYQRYAADVEASGLLVLAAGGNHEVNGAFDNMFGENGLWYRYVNKGVYSGQVEGVTEIAPNGFDFVYRMPETNDYFVFVSQEKWDGRKETQEYLISLETLSWLETVLESHKNDTVHLMLHTYLADDDNENVDGQGDITNDVGYGYHYNYSVYTEDGRVLRELLSEYRNVLWFNGHSHWTYAMQEFNPNLNVFDYYGTFATCIHVPSVTAPRTVSATGKAYASNSGVRSEGTMVFRADGYEIVNGVDFRTGEILAYGCYIVYDEGYENAKSEGRIGSSDTYYLYNEQTASLTVFGNGEMPDFDDPSDAPYSSYRGKIRRIYVGRGVTSVGANAFAGFDVLETVEIKDTVVSIGANAFLSDAAVSSLSFTDSVRSIAANALDGVPATASIIYDGSAKSLAATEILPGNGVLESEAVTFRKNTITFVFGTIRDERDFRIGTVPSYDGTVYKPHEDPEQSYVFAGWTDGLICFSGDLPAVSGNAVYYALFNEMSGGVADGDEKYLHWHVDGSTGVLTISGYGPMRDYDDPSETPWYPYVSNIRSVVVKKGVLSIGRNAFKGFPLVTSVAIETRLVKIGENAMMGMSLLKDLYLPSTLLFGAKRMAYQSSALEHIYYDGSREDYLPVGTVLRLWGNNDDFSADDGKMVYNTCITDERTYTVIFKNDDGTVVEAFYNVPHGDSVTPPQMPSREGEYFLGWNGSYLNITGDLVLTAVYSSEPDPDLDVEIEPKTLTVRPYYGKIENYSGATYFITGVTSDDNESLFTYLKSGAMLLKAILKDETTGRSYVVDEYHFDKPGTEFYATSFLRLNFCPYGVVPDPLHSFTITLEVYSGKNTIYRGASETGAFLSTDNAFLTNGAIVPASIPYTCTVECTTHVRAAGDCETEGVCVYCGEVLPAGAHTVVTDPRVAPTAVNTGLTEGQHCSVCGKIIVAQEIIPATGIAGTNVALYKSVSGVGAGKTSVTDGDTSISNFWDGGLYPSDAVIDLGGYYDISNVNVVTYYGDGRYYYFSVYTSTDGSNWTLIGNKNDNAEATEDGTNVETQVTARYVKVRITKNSKNTSAHLVEVSVYGTESVGFVPPAVSYVDPVDSENVAYGKPTRSNSYGSLSGNVNDGDTATVWVSYYFPSYVDIDLLQNYDLSSVVVYMPSDGFTYAYTLYGSTDGVNFTRIEETHGFVPSPDGGRTFTFESGTSIYRVLRVNVTACGGGTYKTAKIAEVKVYGTPSDSAATETRSRIAFTGYDEWLEEYANVDLDLIRNEDGTYDVKDTFTEADTVNELNGMVTRLLGAQYVSWFEFDVTENPTSSGKDFFRIEDRNGQIAISGSDGVCIASGLNWYLKYYCSVHISQETKQTAMPSAIVPVGTPVFKETALKVRYAYNYCTLSYTMAFYGYEEWRRELDWLYLNGVNLILDITGVEALWVSYLQKLGYTANDALLYACGPGYKAWWLMGNLENFNGTVSDTYVLDMLEMARINQRSMTVMGARPALQTFVGTMPDSFGFIADERLTELGYGHVAPALVAQGLWQGFDRPNVLRTDYDGYSYLAGLFYDTQNDLFGPVTDYYCGDVCHEGGKIPSGLTKADMSEVILENLMASNENGVWMLQRWQSNPTRAELDGMEDYKTTNVIVIDLSSARDTSKWKNTTTYGGKEFGSTNWIFSSLDNFGGRPLMHGALQTVVNNIADAKRSADYMVGMGMTPEGTENNPVYYDLYWEMVWRDEAPDVSEWIVDYARRRYGTTSENLENAWTQLLNSVYAYPNTNGTSGNFMVIGNKPRLDSYVGGYYEVQYSNRSLLTALSYLMNEFDALADNECYVYDLVEIMQTYFANKAQNYLSTIITMSGNPGSYDVNEYETLIGKYLELLLLVDEVSSYSKDQLLGTWIGRATSWASDARTGSYDDYMLDTMRINSKMLISSWTSSGVLIDYANRLYSGLVADYYYVSWSAFLESVKTRFEAGLSSSTQVYASANYLLDALNFVLDEKDYRSQPACARGDGNDRGIEAIFMQILSDHAPESFEPTFNDTDKYAQFGGSGKMFTSVEFYSATNQFETWPVNDNGTWGPRASFHTLIRVNDSGLNYLAANLGTANYPYVWKFYYQEANAADDTVWNGPYTGFVETKSNASFLRHQVSDCPEGDLCADFEVGKSYILLFDVQLKNGERVGFGVLPFTWTQKYEANHDLYTDFWINHDRSLGYRSGDQTVTERDAAVAAALGFGSGSYSASSHQHDFGDWTEVGTGSNGETTVLQRVCANCGYTEREERAITHEHTVFTDAAIEPTCTESGLSEGSHCPVCGEVLVEQQIIPALGHDFGNGVVTLEPTYTREGVMTFVCSRCGQTMTETIPVLERERGDIDADGELTIVDVSVLLDLLASAGGQTETPAFADLNGDGELAIDDVSVLLDLLSIRTS